MDKSRAAFMNTEIDNVTTKEALAYIDSMIAIDEKGYIVTPNADHIVLLEHSADFKKAYSDASLILVDGTPLMWASRIYRKPLKEKICGPDFTNKLLDHAECQGYSVYFLGGLGEVSALAASNSKKTHPGLNIVGNSSPEMGFTENPDAIKSCIADVNNVRPNILILGLGSPKQEFFIESYLHDFDVNVVLCVGAAIDFLAGSINRAPAAMRRLGLEWLYRLSKEPKRFSKRYLRDLEFFYLVFKYGND